MSLSNLIFWVILLILAVFLDLVAFPRLFRTRLWQEIGSISWFTKKERGPGPYPTDPIAAIPASDQPGQTVTSVYSSEASRSEPAPAVIPAIGSSAAIEAPGMTHDQRTVVTSQQGKHIQIEVSLAPGEVIRITVESRPDH